MNLVFDSHAHLDDERFDDDREVIIQNLKKDGIAFVVNPGADRKSSEDAYKLANKYDCIYAAVGTHPHSADELDEEDLERYREMASSDRVVAIGEIGLDYYYDNSPRDMQKDAFIKQLEIAKEVDLPVIIHSREAAEDTYNILREYSGAVSGIIHCYSGSVEMAKKYIDLGYYISLAGPVTFKNAKTPKEVAKFVPIDRLLVETDSPYLTPEPKRGKRNEPANTIFTARYIAELRGMDEDDLFRITTENAKRVYRIDEN
ncbi:MAG: TatD family hydrolase [Tissierellia bacterium]|nr:TatD family hydrolase [Tissierellia bacterium]